jgi:hypothetical protein
VEAQRRFVAALPLYFHAIGRFLPVARLPRNNWAYNGALLLDPSVDPVPVLDCLVEGLSWVPAALIWLSLIPGRRTRLGGAPGDHDPRRNALPARGTIPGPAGTDWG